MGHRGGLLCPVVFLAFSEETSQTPAASHRPAHVGEGGVVGSVLSYLSVRILPLLSFSYGERSLGRSRSQDMNPLALKTRRKGANPARRPTARRTGQVDGSGTELPCDSGVTVEVT